MTNKQDDYKKNPIYKELVMGVEGCEEIIQKGIEAIAEERDMTPEELLERIERNSDGPN